MIHGRLRSAGRILVAACAHAILRSQFVDPAAELFERADHRLDPLRAQTEFFDQPHGAATTAAEPLPGRSALGPAAATC